MAEPARRSGTPDPTHYPVSEKVPENLLNRDIAGTLRHLIERWLAERGETARVGSDQFVYWVQYQPTRTVAPDVYVLPGVDPGTEITAWKTWETGVVPSLAVEVVGLDVRKDYELAPGRYDELGVRELVVYDPRPEGASRVRFQVWRRRRGKLVQVARTDADRVRSAVLGCFLREVGRGAAQRLRLGTGRDGDVLYPTAEEAERMARDAERTAREAAERERQAAERAREAERTARETAEREREAERTARETAEREREAERTAREAAEREREAERAAREAAEEELARIRAELDALRGR
jgi:hypothetical protein